MSDDAKQDMTLEQRIERLQEVVAAYKAVSDMDDDGEDWSMQTIVMADVPELISAIQLQQAELERLREVDDRSSAFERIAKAAQRYRTAVVNSGPIILDEDTDFNAAMNELEQACDELDASMQNVRRPGVQ